MQSETFGEYLKRRRLAQKRPLREVAAAAAIDPSILSKIERNKTVAPVRIIPLLADFLQIDFKILQIKYLSEKIYQEVKQLDYATEAMQIALRRLDLEGKGTTFVEEKAATIKAIQMYLVEQPVEKAWLFGSFARGTVSRDSDVDLLVRFHQPNHIDLFDYVGMRQELEELTGRQIDLVEEGYELARMKPGIAAERELIYESQTN